MKELIESIGAIIHLSNAKRNEIQQAFTPYVISKGDFFLVLKKRLCEDSVSNPSRSQWNWVYR